MTKHIIDCARLVDDLRDAQARGIPKKRLKYYAHSKLLIIDEIGYFPVDRNIAGLFFQLVAARYEKRSVIITTNQPFSKWGEVFGDSVIANAIIDRLVHHSKIIKITGRSYRIKGMIEESEGGPESQKNSREHLGVPPSL